MYTLHESIVFVMKYYGGWFDSMSGTVLWKEYYDNQIRYCYFDKYGAEVILSSLPIKGHKYIVIPKIYLAYVIKRFILENSSLIRSTDLCREFSEYLSDDYPVFEDNCNVSELMRKGKEFIWRFFGLTELNSDIEDLYDSKNCISEICENWCRENCIGPTPVLMEGS